ncbi:MAG: hypothetical protein A4E47_00594 [Methanosaeta sp. PtaU1.Bin028]|nr:MAG: hypothetical protein A4E47_00594 [Methanosaeta sp. PtaU1.Bin028]
MGVPIREAKALIAAAKKAEEDGKSGIQKLQEARAAESAARSAAEAEWDALRLEWIKASSKGIRMKLK